MQDTYDPFSFLLGEIQAFDAGQRDWLPGLRDHYVAELRADEAEELAWGRRHLSVVYGPGAEPSLVQYLDELITGFIEHLPPTTWSRVTGIPHMHVTVTLEGPCTQSLLDLMNDVLWRTNPGWWRVLETAVVVSR